MSIKKIAHRVRAGLKIEMTPTAWVTLGGSLFSGFFGGILALAYLAGDQLYEYKDTIRQEQIESGALPQADVVVVLSGGRGRIRVGSELWFRYWLNTREKKHTPTLFISGMGEGADWSTFAQQVREEIIDVIPPEKVILEKKSTDTHGNAEEFVQFMKIHSQQLPVWKSVVIVTATYHMKRAVHLFRKELNREGFRSTRIETLSVIQAPFTQENWRSSFQSVQLTMIEFIKWVAQ